MKAYIIIKGSYYEISLISVFSKKEDAEEEIMRHEDTWEYDIDEIELNPQFSNIPKEYEKGPTFLINIRIKDKSIMKVEEYSVIKYRHPTDTVIKDERKKFQLYIDKIYVEYITIISPISYEHAEQQGLKYLEKERS